MSPRLMAAGLGVALALGLPTPALGLRVGQESAGVEALRQTLAGAEEGADARLRAFLDALPELARPIFDRSTLHAQQRAYVARWQQVTEDLKRRVGAVLNSSAEDQHLKRFSNYNRRTKHKTFVDRLTTKLKGFQKTRGPIVINRKGGVFQVVGVADDGAWRLLDLANPWDTGHHETTYRHVPPQSVLKQDYVVVAASLEGWQPGKGHRAGLEEDEVWLDGVRRLVGQWQEKRWVTRDPAPFVQGLEKAMAVRRRSLGPRHDSGAPADQRRQMLMAFRALLAQLTDTPLDPTSLAGPRITRDVSLEVDGVLYRAVLEGRLNASPLLVVTVYRGDGGPEGTALGTVRLGQDVGINGGLMVPHLDVADGPRQEAWFHNWWLNTVWQGAPAMEHFIRHLLNVVESGLEEWFQERRRRRALDTIA